MPLRGLAIAYARLADPSAVADGPLSDALRRIRDAMMAFPELVAGEHRRIDTAIMRAFPRRIVSKGGAEGVLAMGLPPGALPERAPYGDGPIGVAAVVEDGNAAARAGDVTSVELLRQLGLVEGELPAAPRAVCPSTDRRPARRCGGRGPARVPPQPGRLRCAASCRCRTSGPIRVAGESPSSSWAPRTSSSSFSRSSPP